MSGLRDVFGGMDGERIPGGCDSCSAYQTVEPVREGIWVMAVHHDDACPWWREYQRTHAGIAKAGAWWRSPLGRS